MGESLNESKHYSTQMRCQMNEAYAKYIAPFHEKFVMVAQAKDIANLYCDAQVCILLPKQQDAQFIRYSNCFAEQARKEDATNGHSDLWALYVLLLVTCFSDLHSEDLRKIPFGPMFSSISGEPQCLSVTEFNQNEFAALEIIYGKVSDVFLKTQIADVLWAFKDKWCNGKDVRKYARYALDSYLETPIDEYHWYYCNGEKRLYRAAQLQSVITPSQGVTSLKDIIENSLLATGTCDDYKLTGNIVRLLIRTKLKLDNKNNQAITMNLQNRLRLAINNDDEMLVNAIHSALGQWSKYCSVSLQMDGIHSQVANYFLGKAEALQKSTNSFADGRIAGWYSGAINAYQKIAKRIRETNGDEKLFEDARKGLERFYSAFQSNINEEKSSVGELPNYAKEIESFLEGRDGVDAIKAFLLGLINFSYDEILSAAQAYAKRSVHRSLFPITILQDGRRVGTINSIEQNTAQPTLDDIVLQYRLNVEVQTLTLLQPAYQYLKGHYCIPLQELESLCDKSNYVPKGHVKQVARGLYYGWCGDFWTAISLLSPQIESAVRKRFREAGLITTTMQQQSIDYEKSISKIIEGDEASSVIIDKMELLELRALFGSRTLSGYAYNLRNDIQHGLLKDADVDAPILMYAWWYVFRMVLKGVVSE